MNEYTEMKYAQNTYPMTRLLQAINLQTGRKLALASEPSEYADSDAIGYLIFDRRRSDGRRLRISVAGQEYQLNQDRKYEFTANAARAISKRIAGFFGDECTSKGAPPACRV